MERNSMTSKPETYHNEYNKGEKVKLNSCKRLCECGCDSGEIMSYTISDVGTVYNVKCIKCGKKYAFHENSLIKSK